MLNFNSNIQFCPQVGQRSSILSLQLYTCSCFVLFCFILFSLRYPLYFSSLKCKETSLCMWYARYKHGIIIQIMHIREVVSKNYSPRGNFIKIWDTWGWKPSVFWIFITLPRVGNFTNDRSPNVHYLFYKMVSKIWAVVSKKLMPAHAIAP